MLAPWRLSTWHVCQGCQSIVLYSSPCYIKLSDGWLPYPTWSINQVNHAWVDQSPRTCQPTRSCRTVPTNMAANVKWHSDRTDLFIFVFLFYFLHVDCTKTECRWKMIAKYFLIVAKNRSRLAAIYVDDDLAANWRLQTLLLLWLDVIHLENI